MASSDYNVLEPLPVFVGQADSEITESMNQGKFSSKGDTFVGKEKEVSGSDVVKPVDNVKKRRISHFKIDLEGI